MAGRIAYHARIAASAGRRDHVMSTVMEEGGTELEAEAEEGELEGPVQHTCEDMELEEGNTELKDGELAEEGELAGPAEEGGMELEAEAELEEGELVEEGELAGAAELEATLSKYLHTLLGTRLG